MELRLTREFDVDRTRIFAAWTDPGLLGRWFWPETFETRYSVDLRVGGEFRFSSPKMQMGVSGTFREVVADSRLVYTWAWDGDDRETLVTVEFADVSEGTRVTLVHERFDSAEERDQHAQGWNDCIDRLPVIGVGLLR